MKTQIEKLPNSRVALEIEVEPSRVEQALDRAYRKVVRRLDVPGFRRGRAPRVIVERRVGREFLLEEALEDLLPEVFSEAVEETGLDPLGTPRFNVEEEKKGSPLRLKAEVDVRPTVELGEYRGLEAEMVIERVTDEDVDRVIEAHQQRLTQLVEPEGRDVAEHGDFVVIDFDGFVDGEPFSGGAARGHMVEIGGGAFVPGFEEQLEGLKIGETRDVTVTFPEEGYPEHLQGREAVFKVTLKEIKVKQVPPVDDELAKEAGEADTLAEWRESIRERLEERAREDARDRLHNTLAQMVIESASVEVPQSLTGAELNGMLEETAMALARQGISLEQYFEQTETTFDDLVEQLQPRAEERARTQLVLDAIAEREGLAPTDEEIEAEREKLFSGTPQGEQELDPDMRSRLEAALRIRKAVEFLEAHANVSERWVDSLEDESEADDAEAGADDVEADEASTDEAGDESTEEEVGGTTDEPEAAEERADR